ncbi:hypothetical protein [Tissierella praeacuta]|uniref:hypothetical protein n=1 Tax=Tissierella praeacuta TaxID=43131 RepID=UPI0033411FCA
MVNPLSRIAMQNLIKDNKPIISTRVETQADNLDSKEEKIITDIINGEKMVMEGRSKNTAITLDEAVNKIKNNR